MIALGLLSVLCVAPTGAANDDLTLPEPTYPEVVRRLAEGDPVAALQALDAGAPAGPALPLEALVLRATLLAHLGRAPDAEAVWQQVVDQEVWMRTFSRRALVTSWAERFFAPR